MKRSILVLAVSLLSLTVQGQLLKPVSWSYAAKKTGKAEAIIYLKATLEAGWHIYSQTVKEGGPVKTTFSFPASGQYVLVGKTIEPKAITRREEVFDMDVSYFEKSVVFTQKIKMTGTRATVKGKIGFMVCNEKQCLPPEEIEFSISVN